MIKGYYLLFDTFNLDKPDGVEKKIISQRDMFFKGGIDMSFHRLVKKYGTFWNNPEHIADADFIYFRRGTITDIRVISFFRKLRSINEKVVVFMEIPTFPYENEYEASLRNRLALNIDHFFRRRLYGLIDRLVIVNNYSNIIWGIKVINLVNGINVKEIRPRNPRKTDEEINICCVAKFSPWHGYERLIRGLSEYYRNKNTKIVNIIMVGTGIETEHYENLVNTLHLEQYVDFRGQLVGEELDVIYDECDIGCCSLGRYKSGIEMTSELKSREFMAKGMPMICGCKIDILENADYPYAFFFPNDNSIIDILDVVDKYNRIVQENSIEEIIERIRLFACENIDISRTFKPVVDEALTLCSAKKGD